jgi:hypothetical protein
MGTYESTQTGGTIEKQLPYDASAEAVFAIP